MPVCLNENKFVALKVANRSLFEAVGIIPDPKATVFTYSGNIRIHVGKPLGIILKSSATAGFSFPNIPPGTILILPQKTDFTIEGIYYQRWGLPCTPGFCLTDYKSQSKSLSNVALGLYSNQASHRIGSFVSLYVQLSRAKSFQSIRLIKHIVVDDFVSVKPSLEMKEAIQKLEFLSDQTIQRWRCKQQGG
ncbi:hypothetical protein B0T18DRAFT_313460 [Schizothecium vesticola]|uniref:Uncharacterized protein n=1 Tax=Schizothecium vesticola TaxID=314040 RepID=A0AA40F9M1_9PEZI|nr:hypothetical protein B0T18DRAFT_313460 [Schizothecium vesticola]